MKNNGNELSGGEVLMTIAIAVIIGVAMFNLLKEMIGEIMAEFFGCIVAVIIWAVLIGVFSVVKGKIQERKSIGGSVKIRR